MPILRMREENLKKREIFENHYIQTEFIVCSNINDHEKFSINLGFIKTSRLPPHHLPTLSAELTVSLGNNAPGRE